MLRYAKYLILGVVILAPKLALGATATFADKQWEFNPTVKTQIQQTSVRSFDLKNLSLHILTGSSYQNTVATFDSQTLTKIQQLATQLNQPVQEAKLEITGNMATTFQPDQNGQSLDLYKLSQLLSAPMANFDLPVVTASPKVHLADLNSLGITELVATGESDFSGSTKNRITNVQVGSAKYNGVIVAPGEEFSFNKILGDVDAEHGFKPELVIKASGVTPEFGGGLCQVSSTMFRAAMNAGFPITARRNHSFAVHYYAPQGTDATIYPGVQDMKFINNLQSHIVIQTRLDIPNHKLYFDFYGTKDDRQVSFEGPVQYDKQANGAMKATWTRHVTLNGQTTTQVFNSTYQPPALFEKTETVAVSTPNPDSKTNNTISPNPTPTPATN